MEICFQSIAPTACGTFYLILKFSSTFSSLQGKAVQIFVRQFIKDVSTDLVDKFTDGGSVNQPMILKRGVRLLPCVSVLMPDLIQL